MYTPFYIGFNLQYGTICAFWVLNPRLWSLSKHISSKSWKSDAQKVPKEAKAKRDGVIYQQNFNFNQILIQKILMLSNATNQPKSTVELGYICPRGLIGQPVVTLTK